mmetsp:Transcript_15863/g.60417  ORF Transcript_15863/g.60417 Transcript_15863/m.60417 type:complete len:327 (-) Transcript_15863:1665-2645(-)
MADLLADQDVSKMSVRQLKTYIHTAGLPTNDCVEKAELVARAQQAKERFVANPHLDPRLQGSGDLPSGGFFKTTASFHGYDCILAGSKACDPAQQEPDAPDLLVLLMHGFGASANDFEDLPSQLMFKGSGLEDKKVVFAFPHAKRGALGVQEWWPIDVERWIMARFEGFEQLIQDAPTGMHSALEELGQVVRGVMQHFGGVPYHKVAFGGFSQGAMTALNLALNQCKVDENYLAGCFMLSGAPVAVAEWEALLQADPNMTKIPIFMSHGETDEVLPYPAARMCQSILEAHGFKVHFSQHPGGHGVGGKRVYAEFIAFLKEMAEKAD